MARELAPFLAGIGAPLAPHLRAILQTDDQVWKYHLIRHVIARSQDLKSAFEADLRRLAKAPSQSESLEELHLAAREALSGPEA